jgi:hypothetical protein
MDDHRPGSSPSPKDQSNEVAVEHEGSDSSTLRCGFPGRGDQRMVGDADRGEVWGKETRSRRRGGPVGDSSLVFLGECLI